MREPFQPMPFFEWKRSTVILVWVASLAALAVPMFMTGFYRGVTRAALPALTPLANSIYGLAQTGQFGELETRGLTTHGVANQFREVEENDGRVLSWEIESKVSRPFGIPLLAYVIVKRESGTYRETLVFNSPIRADALSSEPSPSGSPPAKAPVPADEE